MIDRDMRLGLMHEQIRTGQRRPARTRCVWVVAALVLATLPAACSSDAVSTETAVVVDATSTETPTGDLLLIDGVRVRRALIPDPDEGPRFNLTDEWLFIRAAGRWVKTPTRNDGRVIRADPTELERLYRGDHPPCEGPAPELGVPFETSDDSGTTWSVHAGGENVRPLLVDPDLPDSLYGSDCQLALSSDAGITWTRLDVTPGFPVVDLAIDDTRLYVLGISDDDQGQVRPVDLSDPLAPDVGEAVLVAVGLRAIDAEGTRIVVGGIFGVYVSDDGGASWIYSRAGLEDVTRSDARPLQLATAVPASGDIGVLTVELHPDNRHRIFAGTSGGLYISQDDGATWVRYDEVSASAPITEIQFALGGADLYVSTPRGVIVAPSP